MRMRGLLGQRRFDEAHVLVRGSIERWPGVVEFRELLSHLLLQEGRDLPAAERALRDVLEMDPENAEARHNLDILLHQQGQAQEGGVVRKVSA
jgi:hypothetical protein